MLQCVSLPFYLIVMIVRENTVRVRYAETDRMGYVYYGNYAVYFEVARVEMLRDLGLSYKKLEDSGIILPVTEYNIQFKKPAFYDDVLTIKTYIRKKPSARIHFDYETYNEEGVLLNIAQVTLVFVNKSTGKPVIPTEEVNEIFRPYFTEAK